MHPDTRVTLELALRSALDYLSSLDTQPVNATASLAELRQRLHKPLDAHGLAPEAVVAQLVADG